MAAAAGTAATLRSVAWLPGGHAAAVVDAVARAMVRAAVNADFSAARGRQRSVRFYQRIRRLGCCGRHGSDRAVGVVRMGATAAATAARGLSAAHGNDQPSRDRRCPSDRRVSGGDRAGRAAGRARGDRSTGFPQTCRDHRPPLTLERTRRVRRATPASAQWGGRRHPAGLASRTARSGTIPVWLWRTVDAPWPPLRASMRLCGDALVGSDAAF